MDLQDKLKVFIDANPESELEKVGQDDFRIKNPWGDDSLVLEGGGEAALALAEALEHLILPPRFSALCHCDLQALEFIWTYVPPDYRLIGRRFSFHLGSGTVQCEWRDASERLLTIARQARPAGPPSPTKHRNLAHLSGLLAPSLPPELAAQLKDHPLLSFWVNPVDPSNDEEMVRLAKHLNFFMKYYDRDSPAIAIHHPGRHETPLTLLPLLKPEFPSEVHAREIDQLLLDFALAADDVTETRLKFIYYYQILEYAAFYAIGEKAKRDALTLLRSPDVQANTEAYVQRILDALTDTRMADEQKLERVIQERASAERLWRDIHANRDYFSASHVFEGGFELEACVSEDTSLDAFKSMWGTKIPSVFRRVRNALVHGRESRSNAVIAPTLGNNMLLRPWIPVIRRVAEDVIIYEE